MPSEETGETLNVLEHTRQEFNAAAGGVSESQANARPEAGRWSVLECVEHVTIVEERFVRWLERAERLEAPTVDKQKEAELLARVANRAIRAVAPEPVRPAARFTSLAEALEHFNAARTRTMQFAEERGADLYWLATEHPRFGPMNGAEMMSVIAGHARRHAEQIREVRAALEKSGDS
jgi:uncharacterized damage-inducible protein DinB